MNNAETPIFVDTSAFMAQYAEDDVHHDSAKTVFEGIQSGELPYGPVYTSRYILAELATLIHYRKDHNQAATAIGEIRASDTVNYLPINETAFSDACEAFTDPDEDAISLFDRLSAVVARENGINHVLGFDEDFETMGFTLVPDDRWRPTD